MAYLTAYYGLVTLARISAGERVLIHAAPQTHTHSRIAVPLATSEGEISLHLGEAPYFALVTVRLADNVVEAQTIMLNPHLAEEKAKGIRVAEWLVAQKTDVVLLREELSGRGPVYAFGEAGVVLRKIAAITLNEGITTALSS
jgi:predicted Fe-Mo cluster-binding NifX family protein